LYTFRIYEREGKKRRRKGRGREKGGRGGRGRDIWLILDLLL